MDDHLNSENKQKNMSNFIIECEDIIMSGIGGRFPMSDNCDQFAKNLYDNVDMITEDDNNERWPKSN